MCAKLVATVIVPNQFDGLADSADTDENAVGRSPSIHYYELEDLEVSKVLGVPQKEMVYNVRNPPIPERLWLRKHLLRGYRIHTSGLN